MSNKTDLEEKLPVIEAIAEKDVKKPDMPIDIYIQEAEDLEHTAREDKEKLIARGLKPKVLTSLPVAIGTCRESQSNWQNERFEKQEAEKEYKELAPLAYELCNDLIAEFEYAFRNDSTLMSRVDDIKKGTGHADMIQDLNDLAGLGKKNLQELTTTNFNTDLLDTAAETSDSIAKVLARANGDKNENSELKILRDKAYTYLKTHVDAIRLCGKFVFRKDAKRAAKYASAYYRDR